jgi:hypothetical protein
MWTGKNAFFILSCSITNHSSGYHLNVPTTLVFLPGLGGYSSLRDFGPLVIGLILCEDF